MEKKLILYVRGLTMVNSHKLRVEHAFDINQRIEKKLSSGRLAEIVCVIYLKYDKGIYIKHWSVKLLF